MSTVCDLCPADAADGYSDGETCLCEACCDRLLAGIKSNVEVAAGPADDDDEDDDPENTPLERDAWPAHDTTGEGG